ncbi:dnaJ homolog subfamily C member 3 homolog isoform X3 [Telopea speciosissima]|uniref:dnaJ homolog subfamily C member 3 homolog isoform X3 n=1 Tax=Telopea speciosissima TaxID=54955 RepID=UPI001CC64C52|nr:dnaJ homolog subfamily C member 3 homolog isoform X3 [Telopea speciosissima]
MISEEDEKRKQETSKSSSSWPQDTPYVEREGQEMKVWGILLFGLIGATVTTFAVGQLRRTFDRIYSEERIRRMQSLFNRERNKYKRSYERWRENDPGAYHQHFQRDDWYWTTDTSYKQQRANSRATPQESGNYSLSHHYSVLGLDRWRTTPYTDTEIKRAFRAKAMQYHPDQNRDNKEAAEAKFKEVLMSYEAIKSERKNEKL